MSNISEFKIYKKLAEAPRANAPRAITVAFLGDSVTQGCFEVYRTGERSLDTVYSYKDAFSTRFREIMNLLYPSLRVNIINAGVSGDTAAGGARRVEADALSHHPDLLVVSYGLNDAVARGAKGAEAYAGDLRRIFEKANAAGCDLLYLTQNYMNTRTSYHLTDDFLIKHAEAFAELQNAGVLKQYFERGKEVATACGASVLDGYAIFERLEQAGVDVTELLSNKLNHPIREYHTYIAIKLIEKILNI